MEHNESRMNFFCIDITRPTLYDIGGILFAPLHFFFFFLSSLYYVCVRAHLPMELRAFVHLDVFSS